MKKVLFIDRDGTLVAEPDDEQLDSLQKLRWIPGVFSWLNRISREMDYELVMVTNQDGLGTEVFPESDFLPVHEFIMQCLEDEDISFEAVHIDRSYPHENRATRKPGTGMLTSYMKGKYDLKNSFVIGDRYTDMELAKNLGARGILIRLNDRNLGKGETEATESALEEYIACKTAHWKGIYDFLLSENRKSSVVRETSETQIDIELNLNHNQPVEISTGLGFFDHMLEQIAKHGGISLKVKTQGDLHIDEHHTIEDTALALGAAFKNALGKKVGIERYGYALPMDDCLAQVALDFGGRPWLEWDAAFTREKVGDLPTEMFFHFFKSFSDKAECNLNIKAEGDNEHHKIEAIFKAFARAIKMAVKRTQGSDEVPSTKGSL